MQTQIEIEIAAAIQAHAWDDFEYFGGRPPVWDMAAIRADFKVKQFAEGTESWADFLDVNGINLATGTTN